MGSELEYYKLSTDRYCPKREEENNLCQELTKKEDLERAKNEIRNQYSLNQEEEKLVEEARDNKQLIQVIKKIFEDRQQKKQEIAHRLGTPIELPNSTLGSFRRTNSDGGYFASYHRRAVSLYSANNFVSSPPLTLNRRSSLYQEEVNEKDAQIDELKTSNIKLELELTKLKNKLEDKQGQKNPPKNESFPCKQEDNKQNGQEEQDPEFLAKNQTEQEKWMELASFLSTPKTFLTGLLTMSFLVISGLV